MNCQQVFLEFCLSCCYNVVVLIGLELLELFSVSAS